MTPTLTAPPLCRLTFEPLQPYRPSERGCALAALRKVSEIRVVRNPDRTSCQDIIVQEFLGQSRIPISNCRALGDLHTKRVSSRRPQASCVSKQLADFTKLRDQVFNLAHDAHQKPSSCTFCQRLVEYTFWENHPPNALARLLFPDNDALVSSLSKFVNELVMLVVGGYRPATGRGVCGGWIRILLVVHAFLRDE